MINLCPNIWFIKNSKCQQFLFWRKSRQKNPINWTEKPILRFIRSNKTLLYINQFKALQDELGFLIEKSKNNYYSKLSQKLSNKATCSKAYWSILKTFLNDKKIPCIPPVFHNKFVIDLEKKLNFLILLFLTKKRLSNVQISNENIIKIINNLDPN